MKLQIGKASLELVEGDITDLDVDAIVNPANKKLQMGGGVAGAIRRKGGSKIQDECNRIGKIEVGEAVITTGGNLKAKHVIHAVGPIYGEGNEDEKLKNATLNSLKLAERSGLRSIGFPAISTGIYGFPMNRCAEIMLTATINHLKGATKIERVVFCLYGKDAFETFKKTLRQITKQT